MRENYHGDLGVSSGSGWWPCERSNNSEGRVCDPVNLVDSPLFMVVCCDTEKTLTAVIRTSLIVFNPQFNSLTRNKSITARKKDECNK